jgi:Kef-type K+ transport system membrane component KefB
MRKIAVVVLLVTLVTSVWYFFAYLTWWEWNRAMIAGILMVAAEIGLVTILLLSRLDRLGQRLGDANRAERIKDRLEAAPTRSAAFAWLRDPNQTNVFVPVLLGAGVIASGLAWLIERIARVTSRSGTTSALSRDLAELAPPEGGFLGGDDPIDLLQRPVAR